jgi:2'-5' RNA ligase
VRIARAFLAVVPPSRVLDAVDEATAPTRSSPERLRWVRREAWHLTLQFLGRVDDPAALINALGAVASGAKPFRMQLRGAGAFPSPAQGSVLWAGVGDGTSEIVALAGAVADATAALGFAAEPESFHPHLTLARVRPPRRLVDTIASLETETWGPAWTVDSFALVQSDTRAQGAVYTDRARFVLEARQTPPQPPEAAPRGIETQHPGAKAHGDR